MKESSIIGGCFLAPSLSKWPRPLTVPSNILPDRKSFEEKLARSHCPILRMHRKAALIGELGKTAIFISDRSRVVAICFAVLFAVERQVMARLFVSSSYSIDMDRRQNELPRPDDLVFSDCRRPDPAGYAFA